jgi:EXLDI family protein
VYTYISPVEVATMPNKTIYVSDDDLPLYTRAQELSGGNLSSTIADALRRYVDVEEGRSEGFEEIVVQVGPGGTRKQRFSGVLIGEWGRSTSTKVEEYRVFLGRSGKYVLHTSRSAEWRSGDERWNTGWRAWVGNWSSNQTWSNLPAESKLDVVDTLDQLLELVPADIRDSVAAAARQPQIEDLDI